MRGIFKLNFTRWLIQTSLSVKAGVRIGRVGLLEIFPDYLMMEVVWRPLLTERRILTAQTSWPVTSNIRQHRGLCRFYILYFILYFRWYGVEREEGRFNKYNIKNRLYNFDFYSILLNIFSVSNPKADLFIIALAGRHWGKIEILKV